MSVSAITDISVFFCAPNGRIAAVLSDGAGLFAPSAVSAASDTSARSSPGHAVYSLGAEQPRTVGTLLAPGGHAHLIHFLALTVRQGAVCDWHIDLVCAGEATPFVLWGAHHDGAILVIGHKLADADAELPSVSLPGPELNPVLSSASAAASASSAVTAGTIDALWSRICTRAADPALRLADAHEQIRGLKEQVQPPPLWDEKLLRAAAHDLRNPLLVLSMGCSYLLHVGEGFSEEHQSILRESLDTCDFIGKQLDGITELADIAVGMATPQRQPAVLHDLLSQVVATMAPQAEKRGIAMKLETVPKAKAQAKRAEESEIHELSAYVDSVRLKQAVSKVVDNALAYCPAGSTVCVRLERSLGEVFIHICDNGPGVAESLMPHLFRPFGKARAGLEKGCGGAGMGLALTQRIIEGHGGYMKVDNRPGEGLCVTMVLPINDSV